MIDLHIDYIKKCQLRTPTQPYPSLQQYRASANVGEEDLLDISVSIGGRFVQEQRSAIYSRIDRGSTVRISDVAVLPRLMLCLSSQSVSSSSLLYRSIAGKKSCFLGSMTWS